MITDHRTTFFSGCAALGLTTGVVAAMLTWAPPVVLQEGPALPATRGTLTAPPWTPPAMTRTASSTRTTGAGATSAPSLGAVGRKLGVDPFQNCTAVRLAGAAPIRAGDPGWSPRLDGDGDGIGCDVSGSIEIDWPTPRGTGRPTTVPSAEPKPATSESPEPIVTTPSTVVPSATASDLEH